MTPFGWGDYDVIPDEFENWEPEPECRAKSGECDLNGRCYRCNAIEGERCREAHGNVASDRYEPQFPCPACFESCGYEGVHSTAPDGADDFREDRSRPCKNCHGTGYVEGEALTPFDLEGDHELH